MDSTIISRGGDEMEIEEKEKKEDVKPEKKAKSYGKARKGIYFGSGLGFEGTEAYKLLRTNLKFAIPADKRMQGHRCDQQSARGRKVYHCYQSGVYGGRGRCQCIVDRGRYASAGNCIQAAAGETSGSRIRWPACAILADAIIPPAGDCKFSVVQAGSVPPNPSELLGSDAMKKYLELWKNQFDYIIS